MTIMLVPLTETERPALIADFQESFEHYQGNPQGSFAGERLAAREQHPSAPSEGGATAQPIRVIGQNVLVGGLVPGVVVGGGVVEFVEADCVALAGDGAGGLVGLTGLVPGIFEGCVGGHGGQDPRC